MTTEDRLSALLRDAVPEPPDTVARPGPVVVRARRSRRRRLTAGVVGAAAAVAVAVSLGTALAPHRSATPVSRPALDPYTADPCPAGLASTSYHLEDGLHLPVPADVTVRSIRLCAYRPTHGLQAVPADALVSGLSGLIWGVRTAAGSHPCPATATRSVSTAALVLTSREGRWTLPVGRCLDVQIGQHTARSERTLSLFLAALSRQRSTIAPPDRVPVLTPSQLCDTEPTQVPVDETRDGVVGGATCLSVHVGRSTLIRATALPAATLVRIRAAWAGSGREPTLCSPLKGAFLVVTTRYGDVVRLDSCHLTPERG